MKLVYIGGGEDVQFLNIDFKKAILIDSIPRSGYGDDEDPNLEYPNFFLNIEANYESLRFGLLKRKSEYLHFSDGKRQVYYFYSTTFPENSNPKESFPKKYNKNYKILMEFMFLDFYQILQFCNYGIY
jgi:hypothetical protein